jgi:pSer/pThr/pTyr-binding forkhead associated (FHA) protein
LPVQDKSVSREHARLSRLQNNYVIEDLGSTNGTMVNGSRISEATLLHPGDVVSIGAIDFRFETGEDAVNVNGSNAEAVQEPPAEPDTFPMMEAFTPVAPPEPAPEEQPDATPVELGQPWAGETMAPQPESQESAAPIDVAAAPEPEPPAAQPVAESVPVESGSSNDRIDLTEAVSTARHLTGLLEALSPEIGNLAADRARLQDLDARLGEANARLAGAEQREQAIRGVVQGVPARSMSDEQVQAVEQLLDALHQSPRDIEVLMKIAHQAGDLNAVVQEYAQLRQAIQRISDTVS